MQVYKDRYSEKGQEPKTLNRNTLRTIKKRLVEERPEYGILKSKFLGIRNTFKTERGGDTKGGKDSSRGAETSQNLEASEELEVGQSYGEDGEEEDDMDIEEEVEEEEET